MFSVKMDKYYLDSQMALFSSSDAKQKFGQLLKQAASGPVAIEKHGKVAAYMMSPEFFATVRNNEAEKSVRQLARANQAMIEQRRLIRHHQIAFDLATMDNNKRAQMIKEARAVVDRWRAEHLCSADYIQRWEEILSMQPNQMAAAMVSDADGWGPSLRQNSPWVGVHA